MDVVKDLLTPPDPIQSDHARQVRYDSLQDWRRMMVQQQQQQYPTNNVTAPCRNTSNPATSTATNTLRDGTTPTTPRRVPTTNHFIVEAVPDLTIPVGDARVALAQ